MFFIEPRSDWSGVQPVLALRIGARHCCYSITDHASGQLKELAYYIGDVDELSLQELLTIHPGLTGSFYQVLICYDHVQSALVPLKHYNHEDSSAFLQSLFDVNGNSAIVSESVAEWQVYNVYAVPRSVHDWIRRKFATAKYWHQNSVSIKRMTGGNVKIITDFRVDEFTVTVINNNSFLLSQTFPYTTPGDVLYYLLKICSQLKLEGEQVIVELSGLIDKQSALYKELYQYFLNIHFREAKWAIPGNEYPAHFFTSLNDLVQCAS